jgi:hypothetical protein
VLCLQELHGVRGAEAVERRQLDRRSSDRLDADGVPAA